MCHVCCPGLVLSKFEALKILSIDFYDCGIITNIIDEFHRILKTLP